jgi:hypothetical protein
MLRSGTEAVLRDSLFAISVIEEGSYRGSNPSFPIHEMTIGPLQPVRRLSARSASRRPKSATTKTKLA